MINTSMSSHHHSNSNHHRPSDNADISTGIPMNIITGSPSLPGVGLANNVVTITHANGGPL